jgi:hypothetical protein
MNVLETVMVRFHDLNSAPLVNAVWLHLPIATTLAPIRIDLFQNVAVQNDWQIQILRPARRIIADKSPFAACLAETFRPIGRVHHSIWTWKSLPSGHHEPIIFEQEEIK